jgi:hypothetical protein
MITEIAQSQSEVIKIGARGVEAVGGNKRK